ncbi:MAG: HAD-IIA family hydrolase [Thermoflexia bacterium]|nr:MAG: HAD-IIA family hydrolase [Thermoflexia bacterium]
MSSIGAILLAAGASTRFGQPKQLLDWHGQPMVARVADQALTAGLDPVVVVLGHRAEEVRAALADRPIRVATNWRWEEGISTSVQTGLAALPPETRAAVFLACDQPLVSADLLRELVARFQETGAPIVCAAYGSLRTTPALFACHLFREFFEVTGDQGGRVLMARYADLVLPVEVPDPIWLSDIDTPEAYRRLLERTAPPAPEALLRRIRHLVIDMDGVLWRADEPMPGLGEFFTFLEEAGIRFVLATNNASKRPEEYQAKLGQFGVSVSVDAILTSAEAAAAYLASQAPPGTRVYAIGGSGVQHALTARGFVLAEEGAEYVVVGWDPELHWRKLAKASLLLQRGARFIGTNPDLTYPTPEGLVPGNGTNLAVLELTTGVKPVVIGKPESWLYRAALERMGADPETTAALGDRLDTDILGGKRAGLTTILVLSGITTSEELARSSLRPDIVCRDIADLTALWHRALAGNEGEA